VTTVWLWAHPRSRSTALERMMIERGDVTVLHEPLVTLVDEGRFTVPGGPALGSVAAIVEHAKSLPGTVFVKDTTEYRFSDQLTPELVAGVTHTFVVREPSATIASHVAVMPDAGRADIGYENEWLLFDLVRRLTGAVPVVIDSDLLVQRPEPVIAAYCAAIGLAYKPEALEWEAGDRSEWERTARWHQAAGRSSGFVTGAPEPVPLDGHLRDYYDHHRPFYDRLVEHALRPQ
jgi:Sulfotransferase domain